jgi:hypothetical protein
LANPRKILIRSAVVIVYFFPVGRVVLVPLHGTLDNQPEHMKTLTKQVGGLIDKKTLHRSQKSTLLMIDAPGIHTFTRPHMVATTTIKPSSLKKSYDDTDSQYVYQGEKRSKQEITLPYVLREEVVLLP